MSDAPRSGSQPAGDLGDVWDALDALPRSSASIDMAATTIDMAAVTAERNPGTGTFRGWVNGGAPARGWLWPAVAVGASLLGGALVGRATAPDPDVRVLEYLPLVRHLPLLQEAGSVKFLQSLAARRNQQTLRMPPEMLRDEQEEFDAAMADLGKDHVIGSAAAPLISDRRMAIAVLDGDDRDAIEQSAGVFQGLSKAQQRDLAVVATALADPKRDEIRAAARLWHLIIAASDPPDRRNIVELDAESRLEWLERRSRFREWMGERRGVPPVDGGLPPRGPGMGPGVGPGIGPGPGREPGPGAGPDGRPRWPGPRGDGRGRGDGGPRYDVQSDDAPRNEPEPPGDARRGGGDPRGDRPRPPSGDQRPAPRPLEPRGPEPMRD